MTAIHATVVSRQSVDAALCDELYSLFAAHYAAVSPDLFATDLGGKDLVIVLRDGDGRLTGFSTVEYLRFTHAGRDAAAMFSGDTIIAPEAWGSQELPKAWCRLAGRFKAMAPDLDLYWFLIVKGFRTWRYLPAFTHQYYPNHRQPTPPDLQGVIDRLAAAKFGRAYDPSTGLIRYPESRGHLKPDLLAVRPGLVERPEVAFFFARNPGHVHGDELVCLTELSAANMRGIAKRHFLEGLSETWNPDMKSVPRPPAREPQRLSGL